MSSRIAKRQERREHRQKLNATLESFKNDLRKINIDNIKKENKAVQGCFDRYNGVLVGLLQTKA